MEAKHWSLKLSYSKHELVVETSTSYNNPPMSQTNSPACLQLMASFHSSLLRLELQVDSTAKHLLNMMLPPPYFTVGISSERFIHKFHIRTHSSWRQVSGDWTQLMEVYSPTDTMEDFFSLSVSQCQIRRQSFCLDST